MHLEVRSDATKLPLTPLILIGSLVDVNSRDIVELRVDVKLRSGLGFLLGPCDKCHAREVKRVSSKKSTVDPTDDCDREDEDYDENAIFNQDSGRHRRGGIVVFPKSPDLVRLQNGRITLSFRVTCYWSHHGEREGFEFVIIFHCGICGSIDDVGFLIRLRFGIYDHEGRLLGYATTPPLMVKDDHKGVKGARIRTIAPNRWARRGSMDETLASRPYLQRKRTTSRRGFSRGSPESESAASLASTLPDSGLSSPVARESDSESTMLVLELSFPCSPACSGIV